MRCTFCKGNGWVHLFGDKDADVYTCEDCGGYGTWFDLKEDYVPDNEGSASKTTIPETG